MNERPESLESLLADAPYIDDAGFTESLMKRLPPRRPSLRFRTWILLGSTLASAGIVVAIPAARQLLTHAAVVLVGDAAALGSNLIAAGIVLGLAVWGALADARSDV